MGLRTAPHKVGLAASLAGLLALFALNFGSLAPFRIASGKPVGAAEALGWPLVLVVVVLWLLLVAVSLDARQQERSALVRGLLASAVIVVLFWCAGVAADRLLAEAGPLARYSIGGAVWAGVFCAFAIIIDARRDIIDSPGTSLLLALAAPVGLVALILSGRLSRLGMALEYRNVSADFWLWTGQHVLYAAVAMTVAIAAGVGLGILAHRNPDLARPVFTFTSLFQTIPGLAMIGILAVPLGFLAEKVPALRSLGIGVLGWAPVVVALTLYALLAIVRNTYAGLQAVPEAVVEAARGMGLDDRQVLRKVQLPLSAPIVFSGIRTAAQQTIGNATLGVFVAAGTLGRPIFGGVSQTADDLVLLGAVALVVLALAVDIAMRTVQGLMSRRARKGSR